MMSNKLSDFELLLVVAFMYFCLLVGIYLYKDIKKNKDDVNFI